MQKMSPNICFLRNAKCSEIQIYNTNIYNLTFISSKTLGNGVNFDLTPEKL